MGTLFGIAVVIFIISLNEFPPLIVWGLRMCCGIIIIKGVRSLWKEAKVKKEKNAPAIRKNRERPPILPLCHNEDINTPQRREELIKWNQNNPGYLVEGPCNETPAIQTLRYSLLTTEQLATIPFWRRIIVRNESCHRSYFADSYRCVICGKERYWDQYWCSECSERYENDLKNQWKPSPKDQIEKGYEWVLWRLQQIVAKDLQMHIISEKTARAEFKEIIEVARRDIAEMKKQDEQKQAHIQQQKEQQLELSNIVKRFS